MNRNFKPGRRVVKWLAVLLSLAPLPVSAVLVFQENFESALISRWSVQDYDSRNGYVYWAPWRDVDVVEGEQAGFCAGSGAFWFSYPGLQEFWSVPRYTRASMFKYIDMDPYGTATLRFIYKLPSSSAHTGLFRVLMMGETVWSNTNRAQNTWAWATINLDRFCGTTLGPALSFEYIVDSWGTTRGVYLDWITLNADPPTPDAYEPDNTPSIRRTISNGMDQIHTIHVRSDVDWSCFTIGRGGARNLRVRTIGSGGSTSIQLFSLATGERVARAYGNDFRPHAEIALSELSAGVYFVRVNESGGDGIVPSHRLQVQWAQLYAPDSREPDNSRGAARALANGKTQRRNIHAPGDVDWARFTVPIPGARNVRIETAGANGDTQLWLIRNGVKIAFDDDSGAGHFSRIIRSELTPGTYHIKVQESGNNGTISAYRLRATWTTP